MTRKQLPVLLAILIPILLLMALLIVDGLQSPVYEKTLNRYLSIKMETDGIAWQARSVEEASKAGNLRRVRGTFTFGDNPYFRSDLPEKPDEDSASLRSLPYPPEKLWCAIVESSEQDEREFIFVGEHVDLYNAAVVVHVPDQSPDLLEELLSLVGCPEALALLQRDM